MHRRLVLLLAAFASATVAAQHQHAGTPGGHSHPAAAAAAANASPYAGQETREIKALSAEEQGAWLEGRGSGLAKAAELNGYPGPMHVLEQARELGLSASQQQQTRALMERHKAEVRTLGAELVAAERRLDDLFRTRRATPAAVHELTQAIAALQGRIRASHLVTHVEQTGLLTAEQVAAYDRLRGYVR